MLAPICPWAARENLQDNTDHATFLSNTMSQPVVHDIGAFAEPLLVFGGVYGNLEAFDALTARAEALGIPPARMIHTGDVAAYCADTHTCAAKLKALGAHAIKGNVEDQLAEDAADCACGFDEGSECDVMAMRWYALANAQTTPELRRWMAAMPDHLTFTMAGRRFLVVHGSPRQTNEYIFASQSDADLSSRIPAGIDCVIGGHSGLPFTRATGARLWHNSGALGMPANDGTSRVWYALVAPHDGGIAFTCHALDYDYGTAAAKMRDAGLPEGYASGLESGLWPNTDILPDVETAATGTPLAPAPHLWPARRDAAE